MLYVSGEESERQVKLRGERLGISGGGLFLLAETSLERILEQVEALKPAALVVDSVQTVFSSRFPSAPGSISQVREVATQLLFLAKGRGVTTFLIGHVTKDGSIAGPKSLEHIVDTVLYFEGEKRQHHRIVRAVKNRFGAVSELGVFEMTGAGLKPVANPSALFLSERQAGAPGLGRRVHDRGLAADAGRGAGARVAHVLRHPAAHVARASTPTARACCSPCSRSGSASSCSATTCS